MKFKAAISVTLLSSFLLTGCGKFAWVEKKPCENPPGTVRKPQEQQASVMERAVEAEPPAPNCQMPRFQADGLCYTATRRIIPWDEVPYGADGEITSYSYRGPTKDGECNMGPEFVGAPYVKMEGGAALLEYGVWRFYEHDGNKLDIPDEEDVLNY